MTNALATVEPGAGDSIATPISPPLYIARGDSVDWEDGCDVLVVGFGAAGAAAAIEAGRAGASVVVTDRFEGGGASAKSGGVVYAGGGTRFQKAAGYDDTPEAMHEYLTREVGDTVARETLWSFCQQSVAMIDWLERCGVEFDSSVPPHKTSYPADGYYLYFSGNETVKEYAGSHPPAPRGHRVKGAGLSGVLLFRSLRRAAYLAGARVMTQSSVRRLVVDGESGTVLGAELWGFPDAFSARRHRLLNQWAERLYYAAPSMSEGLRRRTRAFELSKARPRLVRARGGVVVSTGGFIFNREMVARH